MRKLGILAGAMAITSMMNESMPPIKLGEGSPTYSKTNLTKKQKKVRAKNKAAKKARRRNR